MLEINRNPSKGDLRWFGLILGVVLFVIGRGSYPSLASTIIWTVAAVFVVVYYAIPPARTPLFVGFMYAVFPIGWVVSNAILVVVYYLVMTPIGLVMRLVGRDPMERKLRPDLPTYWEERPGEEDPLRYFKQF